MDLEEIRKYCLAKKAVTESLPFDENVLAFKVLDKIFLLTNLQLFESINVKCDPDYALELRDEHEGINGAFHMNKKHWNSIQMNQGIPDDLIYHLINHSYDLVVSKMLKKNQQLIKNM